MDMSGRGESVAVPVWLPVPVALVEPVPVALLEPEPVALEEAVSVALLEPEAVALDEPVTVALDEHVAGPGVAYQLQLVNSGCACCAESGTIATLPGCPSPHPAIIAVPGT